MRRADLTVGQRLYCDGSRDWETKAGRSWNQVEIQDTAPAKVGYSGSKNGVRIIHIKSDGTPGREDVVLLSHLRGDYTTVMAQLAAGEAIRQAEYDRRYEARVSEFERITALAERVRELTGDTFTVYDFRPKVDMTADLLEKLLDRIEKEI